MLGEVVVSLQSGALRSWRPSVAQTPILEGLVCLTP